MEVHIGGGKGRKRLGIREEKRTKGEEWVLLTNTTD